MSTLNFALVNNTGSNRAYAYITGLAIDNGSALFLLQSDGKTAYYPTSPSSTITALAANCAISLGAPGTTTTVTIPHLAGARLWFSRNATLTFYLNPGPALVEPSSSNPSDPNYNIYWDFCEFTWNSSELFVNISMVDFFCLPIALALENTSGTTQTVKGLPSGTLDTVCSALKAQHSTDGAGWDQLIITTGGANLRAVSPNTGITLNSSLFSTYYDSYVDQVWSKYASETLTVDTQGSAGSLTATVSNNTLNFSSGSITYAQPTSAAIFSNSSGSFAVSGNSTKDAITARLAAAFNRSTLLVDTNQPDGEVVSKYYSNSITNHYARICHATALDGRGYAFPYDDVGPSGGVDQSGSVSDGNPKLLTVTVGGPLSSGGTKQSTNKTTTTPSSQVNRKQGVLHSLKKLVRRLSRSKSEL
ncbi:glucan endo-1-3-beta-glucosidase [Penicillium sp. IBT 16267x]|nr:glucan endo-1-3-beta-glucosidase [Penicillium sp. IBT 16267x]